MSTYAEFNHVRVENQKFKNTTVSLDNHSFFKCEFRDCTLLYSGGPVETPGCYFENIRWAFQSAAALTVEALQGFGWKISPPSE